MQLSDISQTRLVNQQLVDPQFTTPKAIVSWMGAMQAQDFPLAKWAIGVCLPGATENAIDRAMDRAEIIRTHVMRPTWHFVAAKDIHWMLELSAAQIKAGQRARDRQLELTAEVYARSNATIEKALKLHGQLGREQLMVELNNAGIATDQNRASHLLMGAEVEQIICSGALQRGKPTYALLAERVPNPRRFDREEALAELAKRYFSSRGPATLQDFTWWSGLPAREARQALESVQSSFVHEQLGDKTYWFSPNLTFTNVGQSTAYLLPNYDEFIISYADRGAAIQAELEEHMKEISNRGVFWPVILVDGQVTGVWKRTRKKDNQILETSSFSTIDDQTMALIDEAAAQYACFVDQKMTILLPPRTI